MLEQDGLDTVAAMIEILTGSSNNYEYDQQGGILKSDRMLFSAVHYPGDYGFIRVLSRRMVIHWTLWWWCGNPHSRAVS
jgi:hypothetical protein